MQSARDKLEELVRGVRMRQEQQAEAAALWKRALPRCEKLARHLADVLHAQGVQVQLRIEDGDLWLTFPDRDAMASVGARARYGFNRHGKTLEGWRTPFVMPSERALPEHFFSLTVTLPAMRAHVNEFGPSGVVDVPLGVDTQQAFERSVVDFFEWAMVGAGCAGIPLRLP